MQDNIKKTELFFIFIFVISSFIYRSFFLYIPFDRDEGTYAYIAERIDRGEIPYKDIFDHKQPFIYYIYKTAFEFFGKDDVAVRTFTNFYILIAFLVFYSFLRNYYNKWLSLLALFIFIIHLNNHTFQGLNSNTEIFLILPLLIAFIFLINYDNKYYHINLFLTGFFTGMSIFIKFMSVFIIIIPVLYIFRYYIKDKIKYLAWLFSGFFFLILLLFIWVIKNNNIKEFIECNFFYNFSYLSRFDFKNLFFTLLKGGMIFIKTNLILFIGILYSLYKFFTNKKDKFTFISVLSVLAFYLSIVLLSGLYPHYYLTLIPFSSILSIILISDLYHFLQKKIKNKKIVLVIIVNTILIYVIYFIFANNTLHFIKNEKKTMDIFYEAKVIAEIINENKKENQTIFVFADEPQIYFYTQKKAPGRYIYNYLYFYKKDDIVNFFNSDFLVLEKNTLKEYNTFIEKNYKNIIEFKNLILLKKEGDKNENDK